MSTFVDSSALMAVLDVSDQYHAPATRAWSELDASEVDLVSTHYVIVEAFTLDGHFAEQGFRCWPRID